MLWDIFCRVIDNYGDMGVCWRLSADLAARGEHVRMWADDASMLDWMAPGARAGAWPRVQVAPWHRAQDNASLTALAPADVWVEAFGCEIPTEFVAHFAARQATPHGHEHDLAHGQDHGHCTNAPGPQPVWINLEYLSAEPYVERCHGLPSPVLHGPARGWRKFFFYPGFTAHTGGLLREPGLLAPAAGATGAAAGSSAGSATLGANIEPGEFLQQHGIAWRGERLISLFCYAPALLPALLDELAQASIPTLLLATHGKAQQALHRCGGWESVPGQECTRGALRVASLPALTQTGFDQLLRLCDLNFVRGEDSVLRALWAGKPFVWQIYPQDDNAHADKLHAFLQRLALGEQAQALHLAWNGLGNALGDAAALHALCSAPWAHWQEKVETARAGLLQFSDLTSSLCQFVRNNR